MGSHLGIELWFCRILWSIILLLDGLEFHEYIYYSETSGIGASGIGEPLKSGHLNFAKIFSHTNEPLESGK